MDHAGTPEETRRHEPVAPPQVGGELDDFLLLDRLGQGAFATVYLAHQKSMHRLVALKVTATGDREAQTLAQLDHPHIVRVFDQRDLPARDLQLLYMEYLPGGTLEPVIARRREPGGEAMDADAFLRVVDAALAARGVKAPMDSILRQGMAASTWPELVCRIGIQLASALDHAHAQGVLHHDVKPGNVLLAANGAAKLADFNISSAAGIAGGGKGETLGGSLPYMSPEQARACRDGLTVEQAGLDGRSDLFALGVVLWELLCGRRPFPEVRGRAVGSRLFDEIAATRSSGVSDEAMGALPEGVSPLLRDALLGALRPEREQRVSTGADLARRLEVVLDREARALLTAPTSGWRAGVRTFPLAALLVVGLLPNVILSALNIAFNLQVVAGGRWHAFQDQVAVINLVMYALGIGIGVGWALVVTRRGSRPAAILLGDRLAVLLVVLWSVAGVVFAVWRHAQQGDASAADYLHFTLSMSLFGILAATLCFFLVNRVTVSVLLPAMVTPGEADPALAAALHRLAQRSYVYYALCTAVPFLAVIALALEPGDHRSAFLSLGILGALAFGLTTWLSGRLRRDVGTLARVLDAGRTGATT